MKDVVIQSDVAYQPDGVYIDRLTVHIPSRHKPGYIHGPGSEFAPVEQIGPDVWLIEIRVLDESLEGDAWYETFAVNIKKETEMVLVKEIHGTQTQ